MSEKAVEQTERVSLFSWKGLKLALKATDVTKYDAERWGIYHFSSIMTAIGGTILLFLKSLAVKGWAVLVAKLPWLTALIKGVWVKISAMAAALWHVAVSG